MQIPADSPAVSKTRGKTDSSPNVGATVRPGRFRIRRLWPFEGTPHLVEIGFIAADNPYRQPAAEPSQQLFDEVWDYFFDADLAVDREALGGALDNVVRHGEGYLENRWFSEEWLKERHLI